MGTLVIKVYGVNVCVLGCARKAVEVYDVVGVISTVLQLLQVLVVWVAVVAVSGVITAGTDCTTTVHQKKL